MSGNKAAVTAVVILTAFAGIGAGLFFLWKDGFFLPRWIKWENVSFTVNAHAGQEQYEIRLAQKAVSILRAGSLLWSSPKEVRVQSAVSGDIDGDGEEELILLCWKRGRYGRCRPFWVEKDERGWSQHIFVYEYDSGKVTPKWMSSYIGQEVGQMQIDASMPPRSRLWLTEPGGMDSRWVWDSWGFAREDTDVSFVVFGDNLIHEPIYRYGLRGGSFDFLFANFHDILSQSDVCIINQETPLTDNPVMYGDYPRFGTPLQVGEAIADAGFDVVTCATNHALDRGVAGIETTKQFFAGQDIVCLGIQTAEEKENRPYEVITKNGIRFALFNYTYGTNGIRIPEGNPHMVHLLKDEEEIRKNLAIARADADIVLVFAHWGTEYEEEPDAFQQKWSQIFLESKVDVVVGTHPHALQPYTFLQGDDGHRMLVYYSLGNFISAQDEKSCIRGGMAEFTVSRTPAGCKVSACALRPLMITRQEDGQYRTDFLLPLFSIPMGE